MKKITLVLATMLLSVTFSTTAKATSDPNQSDLRNSNRYRFSQPIMFMERGIEFYVFHNGEFDFNTKRPSGYSNINYKNNRSRHYGINRSYGAPGVRYKYNRNKGVLVTHDRLGRVHRVGNVFINYDAYGRVKRIGSVYMKYYRRNLEQVGGLQLQYNRWGKLISITGKVKYVDKGCGFCGMTGCSTSHLGDDYNDDHHDDWNDRDDWQDDNIDVYYYKKAKNRLKNRRSRSH